MRRRAAALAVDNLLPQRTSWRPQNGDSFSECPTRELPLRLARINDVGRQTRRRISREEPVSVAHGDRERAGVSRLHGRRW